MTEPRTEETEAAGAAPDGPVEVPAEAGETSPAPVASESQSRAVSLRVPEIRTLAEELATQLFQRWELALQEQFRAELGVRLEAELEHREHQARDLRDEVQERRAIWEGMWSARHPRGATTDTTRWEMEQTMRRQASELAETERQMAELRERLAGLGFPSDGTLVTVEAEGAPPGT